MTKLKAGERGSALILVLGVLVLLSIVGTAFVTISRIERRATRNYADDIEARLLAQQAAAFVAQHPNWEPPRDAATASNNDVDNDNIGGLDSQWFTYPLADLSADTQARFAILKKPFGGRLDLNRVSHFVGGTSQNHILNEGASPGEISLVDAIAAGGKLAGMAVTVEHVPVIAMAGEFQHVRRKPVVVPASAFGRHGFGVVIVLWVGGQMPFAYVGCIVTGFSEPMRQSLLVERKSHIVLIAARFRCPLARLQDGPRRTAHGLAGERPAKQCPLGRQAVEVWRDGECLAVAAAGVPTLLVGEEEDHVRSGGDIVSHGRLF